ncbi:CPBP family intramembrane glutamic endopeptidase [Apilactobacillus timberlakei]|uniref:CPBP family intramembrane metalloprotease n=1 Tax=Apilactobacillus timberlakei TaxID=2008380 RepID=A0ABY2YSG8_9LACO|nr:CPBP family intramembrane glutamic endopeptidase [Apilactobacillus timberlakei]TPR14165.1 CPBP family intramembrane metalloprotease [Apilactobacillus timberlakei]TPR16418.1 CPBP family intramembrane metalloprotease [Apilactobacillus timberlakei]
MIPLILALELFFDQIILPLVYGLAYELIFHQGVHDNYILFLNLFKILSIFVILILNYYIIGQKFYLKPNFAEFGWQIFIFICLLIIAISVKGQHFGLALDIGIIAALPEEIMFRGVIMGWVLEKITKFKQSYINVSIALGISGLIFGCFHYINLAQQSFGFTTLQVMNAVGLGMILGAIYVKSGSLFIPIATHFIWDFVVTLKNGMPETNYVAINGQDIFIECIILAIQASIAIWIVCFHFENNLLLQKIEKK